MSRANNPLTPGKTGGTAYVSNSQALNIPGIATKGMSGTELLSTENNSYQIGASDPDPGINVA